MMTPWTGFKQQHSASGDKKSAQKKKNLEVKKQNHFSTIKAKNIES